MTEYNDSGTIKQAKEVPLARNFKFVLPCDFLEMAVRVDGKLRHIHENQK